MVISSSQMLHV